MPVLSELISESLPVPVMSDESNLPDSAVHFFWAISNFEHHFLKQRFILSLGWMESELVQTNTWESKRDLPVLDVSTRFHPFKTQNSLFQRVETGETVQPSSFKLPNAYECPDTEYQLTFSAARLRYLFLLNAHFCFLDLKAAGVIFRALNLPTVQDQHPLLCPLCCCCPPASPTAEQHRSRPLGKHAAAFLPLLLQPLHDNH